MIGDTEVNGVDGLRLYEAIIGDSDGQGGLRFCGRDDNLAVIAEADLPLAFA